MSGIKNAIEVRALALALGVTCAGQASAEAVTLTCPATLTAQQAAISAPDGWSSGSRTKEQESVLNFSTATFTAGPPDKLGFLRPSGESKIGDELADDYDLASIPAELGIWFVCFYEQTPAYYYRKLDTIPAKCSVSQTSANAEKAATCG
jgi:hypothetical protein